MKKHQLFTSKFTVDRCDMVDSNMSPEQWIEHIKDKLISFMIESVVKKNNLHVLTKTENPTTGNDTFSLSLVIMNPYDYRKLEKAIDENNYNINIGDDIIMLKELL